MKRHSYPVLLGLVVVLVFVASSLLGSLALLRFENPTAYGVYLPQLLIELLMLAVMVGTSRLLGMGDIYRPSGLPAARRWLPALPLAAVYTLALLETVVLCRNEPLQPLPQIVCFVLCMLAVGLTEELTFRGIITRMLYERYGGSAPGVWLSVLAGSLLFGLVHLINAVGGTIELGGVLVQMVCALALGMCLAAIYLRTKSLWTVALLHGYMDLCALMDSGVYASGSLAETVGGYSISNLLGAVFYAALAVFLLRPGQMKKITAGQTPTTREVIGLMAAVMLASGLTSAVVVLTL